MMSLQPPRLHRFSLTCVLAVVGACHDSGVATSADASTWADASPSGPTRPPGVALCYSEFSTGHEATAAFWSALRGGRPEGRADVIAALKAATRAHPREEELALLHGLAHLWRLAEPLPEEMGDQALLVESVFTARRELERAYELCPTDHRIPAWLGPLLVRTGEALGDRATIDEGLAVLERGIAAYPAFVLFSKLLVYADRPRDDPDFMMALAAVEENVGACVASDPACSNHARAAHNVEGALVFLGDVIAKAGQRDEALAFYEMALAVPEYPEWDYQALIADRIATVDARVAAYDTPDPSDDHEAVWQSAIQCSICHRE